MSPRYVTHSECSIHCKSAGHLFLTTLNQQQYIEAAMVTLVFLWGRPGVHKERHSWLKAETWDISSLIFRIYLFIISSFLEFWFAVDKTSSPCTDKKRTLQLRYSSSPAHFIIQLLWWIPNSLRLVSDAQITHARPIKLHHISKDMFPMFYSPDKRTLWLCERLYKPLDYRNQY